jgi:hypothetical protein
MPARDILEETTLHYARASNESGHTHHIVDFTAEDDVHVHAFGESREVTRALKSRRETYGERFVEGRVLVFTYRASQGNQFRMSRRAGVGAFWSEHQPFNISERL